MSQRLPAGRFLSLYATEKELLAEKESFMCERIIVKEGGSRFVRWIIKTLEGALTSLETELRHEAVESK